ncbi:MAG: glucosamine-6-phosphate deaminase, partial [Spirochaetaceae bacterium]
MAGKTKKPTSGVETAALKTASRLPRYTPEEKIDSIVVNNFPALGTLTAARFLEWVRQNPEGVISLPTGRTPEHFIREVQRLLGGWREPAVQAELESLGLDPDRKPELKGLQFVQIDEFYPVNPRHNNSFYDYVRKYYIEGFGLSMDRALLINCEEIGLPGGESLESFWAGGTVDLGLRYRPARTLREQKEQDAIRHVDQWCEDYEQRIRDRGGIGFFLGGIGPDGHIGFNVR